MGALLVISVLSLGLQATGARRIAAHPDQVVAIERIVLGVGLRSALVLGGLCLLLAPVINEVLRLDSLPTALLVGVAAVPLTYMGAQSGVLQGERRWEPLALVYLSAGLGRILIGTGLILVRPGEFAAMLGVALGCWVPVIVAYVALRRPRVERTHEEGHPGIDLIREVGHSSQALLAFFALSNADILICRAVMSDSQAGLYASGLIMVKAILFFPQFVVVIAFPSMSKQGASRQALALALAVSAALGSLGVLGTLLRAGHRAPLRGRRRVLRHQGRPLEVRHRRHAARDAPAAGVLRAGPPSGARGRDHVDGARGARRRSRCRCRWRPHWSCSSRASTACCSWRCSPWQSARRPRADAPRAKRAGAPPAATEPTRRKVAEERSGGDTLRRVGDHEAGPQSTYFSAHGASRFVDRRHVTNSHCFAREFVTGRLMRTEPGTPLASLGGAPAQ